MEYIKEKRTKEIICLFVDKYENNVAIYIDKNGFALERYSPTVTTYAQDCYKSSPNNYTIISRAAFIKALNKCFK
jgi:hypothetical protein